MKKIYIVLISLEKTMKAHYDKIALGRRQENNDKNNWLIAGQRGESKRTGKATSI